MRAFSAGKKESYPSVELNGKLLNDGGNRHGTKTNTRTVRPDETADRCEGLATLRRARIAVAGLGELVPRRRSLARAGIGWLVLIDYDAIEITNTNRQIHALAELRPGKGQ